MSPLDDEAFTEFLRGKAAEAEYAAKYRPNDLIMMLGSLGGYGTAVSLLSKTQISDGFIKLWEVGRLDLTIEALVLGSDWCQCFDSNLLKLAKERLDRSGYKMSSVLQDAHLAVADGHGSDELSEAHVGSSLAKMFVVGIQYSRSDIFKILEIAPEPSGGAWFTGYVEHNGDHFIFCNIGAVGRTGHDYDNHFSGDQLVWFGKRPSKIEHASIKNLLSPIGSTYIFYRLADRDPFMFAGVATPSQVFDTTPVKVIWDFMDQIYEEDRECPPSNVVLEGAARKQLVKVYERNRGARLRCVNRWGWCCFVCRFDFEEFYGQLGERFIHVHHLKPLSEIGEEYLLDPEKDLRPVCPNCHAMLHRVVPALTIEQLQELINLAK